MANLVYKRVSTDEQSTDRQNLVLAEAAIEDPGNSRSRLAPPAASPSPRPKFGELLRYAGGNYWLLKQ